MRGYFSKSTPDYVFIGFIVLIVIFGLVMLASASSDLAKKNFGDSYYYLNHQILYGLSFGLFGFLFAAFINYRFFEKFALILLIFNVLLLLLVWSPLGVNLKGGDRWLAIGDFTFQPSEVLKLTFLVYLAAWLARKDKRNKSFTEGLAPFIFLVGGVTLLLVMEPATTTAIIIFAAAIATYFAAGARVSFIALFVLLAVLALSILIYLTPYRLERVKTFLNPETDQLGKSYHINQSLIAIGSGGLTGVGYGKSTTKLYYLPEPIGDSIFAVIAEELGFLGALALISLFFCFVWRGFKIAKNADVFGRLMVIGFVSLIGFQAFINIAAISGLIPLTGVPLPFISYGGTSLAVFLTMSGIIVNVSRRS